MLSKFSRGFTQFISYLFDYWITKRPSIKNAITSALWLLITAHISLMMMEEVSENYLFSVLGVSIKSRCILWQIYFSDIRPEYSSTVSLRLYRNRSRRIHRHGTGRCSAKRQSRSHWIPTWLCLFCWESFNLALYRSIWFRGLHQHLISRQRSPEP